MAINHLKLNEKTESGGRFSIGKRTSSLHGPCSGPNTKLEQPYQVKQEIEFGCRFKVTFDVAVFYISLEKHPIIVPFWHLIGFRRGTGHGEAVATMVKPDYVLVSKHK